jgi:ABC-type antimicrobial peptide transport system permease subunit
VLHSERSGADVARLLRATLDGIDRGQPFRAPVLMSDHVERSLSGSRFQAEVLSFFAWSALLAAAAGLYGLLTYMVRNSRREWAIRLALGATSRDLRRHVFHATASYAAYGIGLGLALFALASRSLQAIVFGVSAWNPAAVAVSVLVLGSVCLGAATMPAWRAGLIAPADVLRE